MDDGIPDVSFGPQALARVDLGQDEECTDIAVGDSNSVYIAGTSQGGGSVQFGVAKLDENGQLDVGFTSQSGAFSVGTGDAYCNGIGLLNDGSIILGGDSEDTSQIAFTLVKLLPDGSRDNSFAPNGVLTTPLGTEEDLGNALAIQPDGRVLLAGESSDNIGNSDIAVARYYSGFVVGLDAPTPSIGMQIYPHPLQQEATLEFQLSTPGLVELKLYDLQGKLLATPISATDLQSGPQQIRLEFADLAAGSYLLHLQTPDGRQALKLIK